MENLFFLIPALPILGFIALALFGRRMSAGAIRTMGVGSIGFSLLCALASAGQFLNAFQAGRPWVQTLWQWFAVPGLAVSVSLKLDSLSLIMALVVVFVSFLIHVYSAWYMDGDEEYGRFFAWMNLFTGAMLTLVLAGDILLLYLGWEGVGLCSYLLIGFWYKEPANARAAIKAFIVTRVGDTAFLIGLFLIALKTGTLDIAQASTSIGAMKASGLPTLIAMLLLGGAVGKSAQLPLQTWLPDAMAGPTPVSALIHAATMVTAGVYLIARMNAFFVLSPVAMEAVAAIGALTLFLAAVSALFQTDIKRMLAYSTMSQIGYMFLGLGVGAWSASLFHFMTHAFFKALLFMSAGVIIKAMHEEHDIFKIRKKLLSGTAFPVPPIAFWSFLTGGAALAALPFITSGAYSKDMIISGAWTSGHVWVWALALAGSFLTGLYTFRVFFTVFAGTGQSVYSFGGKRNLLVLIPLAVLSVFSVVAGYIKSNIIPFLGMVLPAVAPVKGEPFIVYIAPMLLPLIGIALAWLLYSPRAKATALKAWAEAAPLSGFFLRGWDFDRLYDFLIIRPYKFAGRLIQTDPVDLIYSLIAVISGLFHFVLGTSQTGKIRLYAALIGIGTAIIITWAVLF
ncbi:MAG: NADH-quinone oxidoreductase subunit L [Actinomycetota bacterium]|nr:NADH-quinone oxidoreductase subunit L [Actinomycetota bacterium]